MNHKDTKDTNKIWKTCDRFLEIRSHWFTLMGEHLQDERGQILEYWRIDKPNSAVILPIQNQEIFLPPPTYRPGVEAVTLDFPGGRIPPGKSPEDAVSIVLQRELGIEMGAIAQLTSLTPEGWAVNSSFSNQKLYGFVAEIQPTAKVPEEFIEATYPATESGVSELLKVISCLQCRTVLLEWWLKNQVNNI
jgi:8-oxo-dGTP pyrophosphatase MutT (NUDIX family)